MTVELTEFRTDIMKLMSDQLPDDVAVIDHIPDSIAPPAVVWGWAQPWLAFTTWCQYTSNGELIVVSQRIEPGGHLGILESLVTMVVDILRGSRIAIRDVTAPYPIVLGGVNYLATSVNIIHELGD